VRLVLLAAALVAPGCATQRPIHPFRLEGFPGAPIEPGLFELVDGATWVLRDELNPSAEPIRFELTRSGDEYRLHGATDEEARIQIRDGFLEILYGGKVARPLKLTGKVGDTWTASGARCMAYGYDRLDVLGREVRALVVAVERKEQRVLYWFSAGLGVVRVRTERLGHAVQDARLVEHHPGAN